MQYILVHFYSCPEVTKDSQFLQNVAECKNLSRRPENGKLWGGHLLLGWRDGWMDGWMGGWVDDWLGGATLLLFTVTASHIHTLWVTGSFKTGANGQKLLCLQACFCNGESSGWGKEALQIPRPEISPCLLAKCQLVCLFSADISIIGHLQSRCGLVESLRVKFVAVVELNLLVQPCKAKSTSMLSRSWECVGSEREWRQHADSWVGTTCGH